jgi:hypothetical protein
MSGRQQHLRSKGDYEGYGGKWPNNFKKTAEADNCIITAGVEQNMLSVLLDTAPHQPRGKIWFFVDKNLKSTSPRWQCMTCVAA